MLEQFRQTQAAAEKRCLAAGGTVLQAAVTANYRRKRSHA
jgi:hypothetical protein